MPAGLYFVLKYFSFTSGLHLAESDLRLKRHNIFGPFDDVRAEFDCSSVVSILLRIGFIMCSSQALRSKPVTGKFSVDLTTA
jgi:hypothetical protein